ncbi:MAG: isocitrate/isopropylmalate family dehydrogenase [Pseudomonadota bacterium]
MSAADAAFRIALVPGDGIGPDVVAATRDVLDAARDAVGGFTLTYDAIDAGAAYFARTGTDISLDGMTRAGAADAILLGAIGLPGIRHDDGTEISPHLRMRDAFRLFAGVRPIKAYPNTPRRLADPRAGDIDFVILRESTEGLFFSHGRGEVSHDEARDTLRITRAICEDLFDFAFRLTRRRKASGAPGLLTCVDKANVFRSMAFFRAIFDERAEAFPDITRAYAYVDAQALDLVRRPWDADVLVTENMFGDILSDLGGGLVGGMGMAPCAEIGLEHGLFQPAHGSAPDIAGKGIANPTAALISGALMLDWLGEKKGHAPTVRAGKAIDRAVWLAFERGTMAPREFGGDGTTRKMAAAVVNALPEALAAIDDEQAPDTPHGTPADAAVAEATS